MRIKHIIATLALFSLAPFAGIFADEDPKSIVDKANQAIKLKGAEAISVMTIYDSKGRKRICLPSGSR